MCAVSVLRRRRVDRRKCGQQEQALSTISFVDITIDLLWRNFLSLWDLCRKEEKYRYFWRYPSVLEIPEFPVEI